MMPVVLCIDVEPDPRVFSPHDPPPWAGAERFLERVPTLRERLAGLTGAPAAFTWCLRMDPQIEGTWGTAGWVAEAYGPALAELVAAGDELGLHTHTWRWDTEAGEWFADFGDDGWAVHCVDVALDAYENAFGRPCEVHRGGDHFLSAAMLARLGERGVLVDLTVEPGQRVRGAMGGERTEGRSVDYAGLPTTPYRASANSFPQPDPAHDQGPLLVPLMSALGRSGSRSQLPPDSNRTRFVPRLALELLRGPKPPVVAFAVRVEASLGRRWEALEGNLAHLARRRGTRFVTATAALGVRPRPTQRA
jgi:hypothetical protein